MKQRVCDRCGKVIKPHDVFGVNGPKVDVSTGQYLKKYGLFTKKYDLCYDCYEALELFLKGEEDDDT